MDIIELKMKKNKKEYTAITYDGENISLTPDVIVKYSICVGENDDEILSIARHESDCAFALNKATNWMTASYRSESELKRYLWGKKYNADVINYVVEKLKEYNFLNDESLATNFVAFGQNKMGIYKMRQKLMQKGVCKDIIDKALCEVDSQDDICYNMAIKKLKNSEKTPENMAKLQRFLVYRGFDFDTIRRTFNRLKFDGDEFC